MIGALSKGCARASFSIQEQALFLGCLNDRPLSVFLWAHFRKTKGAIKLHVGLDHEGCLPAFVSITEGKTADIKAGRDLSFPKGRIVACDRGYTDYRWYNQLTDKGIFFVSRLKSNARYAVLKRRNVLRKQGLTCFSQLRISGSLALLSALLLLL